MKEMITLQHLLQTLRKDHVPNQEVTHLLHDKNIIHLRLIFP